MKITKLKGKNFRTLKGDFDIPFTGDTINLFLASYNGAGKTSIFYAFLFLIANYVAGKTIDDYINWSSDEMTLETEFEFQGLNFRIEYSNRKGKADKTLFINGEEYNGVSVVNKKLKEYFEPSLFIPSVFIEQDAKNFTSIKPAERREHLKKIFNLDFSSNIKEIEKEEKEFQEEKINKVEKDLVIAESRDFPIIPLKDLPIEEGEYKVLEREIESLKNKIDDNRQKITINDSNKNQLSSLESQLRREEERQKDLDAKLENVRWEKNAKLDTFEKEETLKQYQNEFESIKLERVKAYDNEELLATAKQNLSDTKAQYSVEAKKLSDCKNGICPTCGKDFDYSDTQSIKDRLEILKNRERELEICISQEETTKKTIEDSLKENEEKKHKRQLLENKITSLQENIESSIQQHKENLERLAQEETTIIKDLEVVGKTIKEVQEQISKIEIIDLQEVENEIKESQNKISTIESILKEYDSIKTQNEVYEKTNKENEQKKKDNDALIIKLKKNLEEATLKKQQYTKMKNFLRKEFPSYVVSTTIEQIEFVMNEFISKVYYKDLDVEIVATDDSIDVLYGTGDKKIDAVNASGAEESLLSLAYCYALNKLNNYNLLLVDEVDSSFTEEAAQILAEMIMKIKDEYDFIGLITHVDVVQDYYESNGANMVKMEEVV